METNTSQPSEKNAVGCFYGTLRKKLLMINTEKGKGKKSFRRDWLLPWREKIHYRPDEAIQKS